MKKNCWLLLFFALFCPILAYAGVVSINDTGFSARSFPSLSYTPLSINNSGLDNDNNGLLNESEPYSACDFSDCDNYSDCQYYDVGSMTVASNYCNCTADNTDISLCDPQLSHHSTVNYNGYARGLGVSADSSLTLTSGQNNYYYYSDVSDFCPVILNSVSEPTLNSISQSYYSSSRNLNCSSSITGLGFVANPSSGVVCIKPGLGNYLQEQMVRLCIYAPSGNSQADYQNALNYQTNSQGLQDCASPRNNRLSFSTRSLYSMENADDLPSSASNYYYQYRPSQNIASDASDYHLSECAFACGISGSSDITPICQGWYYLRDCNAYRNSEDVGGYYVSPTYSSYTAAVAASAQNTTIDVCYTAPQNKSFFIRCGIKHSADADNGVYSSAECQTNNGVCSDVANTLYSCGGETYCSSCVCQSGLVTLAEWCSSNGITENCDINHYMGVGNGCNYENNVGDLSGDKYTSWTLNPDNIDNLCHPEGQYVALSNFSGVTIAQLHNIYGNAAVIKQCVVDNNLKWQITCGSEYAFICGINDNQTDWCIHGRNSSTTMRSEATMASPTKYCQSGTLSGICGVSIMVSNSSGNTLINASDDLKIYEVESPEQCYNQYGRAASVQSCIASGNNTPRYNCYYDLREYIYSTTKDNGAVICPVRHDLTGNYVVYKGQKRWSECNCMSLYDYSIYTCSGNAVVSGKACTQDLSNVNSSATLINKWKDKVPYDEINNRITVNSVDLYPHCKCDDRFKYTCDDNSRVSPAIDSDYCQIDGRYYYESCQCAIDEVPDHWSNNYFNCAPGAHPTGVWKDDGCGGKMYQCSDTIVCTSEYNQTCSGVGQTGMTGYGCQNDEGEYVLWKRCQCDTDSGWHTCLGANQSGVGEACVSGNINYYQSCSCPDGWATCDGNHEVDPTVQSCQTDDGVTVYASCGCNSNYTLCNDNGQTGDTTGGMCTISGTTVYESCVCESEYNKTCQATSSNHIHGDSSDVCTINGTSGTESYYKTCQCDSGYNLTCSTSDHLVPADTNDYCQTSSGATTYYAACQCDDDYTETCDSPLDSQDFCELEGVRYYTAANCGINEEGCSAEYHYDISNCSGLAILGGSTCVESNVTLYTSCTCPSGYIECADFSGIDEACVIDGTSYYQSCACPIFDGQVYTSAIVTLIGVSGQAAYATAQYTPSGVSTTDSHFGAGHWYLPAIGELKELYSVKSIVNTALSAALGNTLTNSVYWSSSEGGTSNAWRMNMDNGNRANTFKDNTSYVRAFRNLYNELPSTSLSNASGANIGDIVYSDVKYDSYNIPHTDKVPVGIVYWVSEDGLKVRIVALDDIGSMAWSTQNTNITAVPDVTALTGCSMTIPQ